MTHWRNLVVVAALALAATPSLLFGRRNPSAVSPHRVQFSFLSSERDLDVTPETPALRDASATGPDVTVDKSGTIPVKQGMRLQVNADPGNVHIFTDESNQVSYHIHVQADARESGAEELMRQFTVTMRHIPHGLLLYGNLPWREFSGPFRVSYEIHVPRQFNITVHTLGGNIEVQDIQGQVDLFTEGGNITAGRVDDEYQPASTAPLRGQSERLAAKLTTMGGHITIGDVSGTLRASTYGGHITAGNISGDASLHTGGGQILTGRITGVGTVDTGGGNITTSLSSQPGQETADKDAGKENQKDSKRTRAAVAESQFASSEGDIVVYLPHQLAATVDATIERGDGHKILADPLLPQKISCQDSGPAFDLSSGLTAGTTRCIGDLNGGGQVLHLRAASGNIILKVSDPPRESDVARTENWVQRSASPPAMQHASSPSTADDSGEYDEAAGFFAEIRRRILESWWGSIPVDAAEMQKHLEHSVSPVYPDVARQAGVEGDVVLRIFVSSEGRVTDLKVLEGPPILARAAVQAVQQWRYHALKMNGQPVAAVTTIIVSFRLR